MKKDSFQDSGNWFGYSRRERRSSFILLVIIIIVFAARYAWPGRHRKPELQYPDVTLANTDTSSYKVSKSTTYRSPVKRYQSAKRITVELNSCDSASLDALPGIGPVFARRIIRYRNLLGGYSSPDQLREVYGLNDSTFMLVRGRVKADSGLIRKIRVNGGDFKTLSRLPYFEKAEVIAILNFRAKNGNIGSIDELVQNQIITSVKAEKVKPYLDFGK